MTRRKVILFLFIGGLIWKAGIRIRRGNVIDEFIKTGLADRTSDGPIQEKVTSTSSAAAEAGRYEAKSTRRQTVVSKDAGRVQASATAKQTEDRISASVVKLKQRQERLRSVCAKNARAMSTLRPTGVVWTLKSPIAHYCITPKVGCTVWKQIFRFLSGDYGNTSTPKTPSDIDKMFVHYASLKNINTTKLFSPLVQARMANEFAFMFARNPYTRLWSAYIDKFLLPDFWRTDALPMMRSIRPNASRYDLKCANNVSFTEFLQFIVKKYPANLNDHWQPVYKICNPCKIDYDVIGTQETFTGDTKYILSTLGIGNITTKKTSKEDPAKNEVKMLTVYNFNLETKIRKGCFDKLEVARRLWKAFQFNGYVHRSFPFPTERLNMDFISAPIATFLNQVTMTMKYQRDNNIAIGSQKKEMMLEAYQQIPPLLLARVQAVYDLDFQLFGYNSTLE